MNTTQKPLLLLDVDGVLNAFDPTRPHTIHKIGGRQIKGQFVPYTIHFDNEIVEMLDILDQFFEIHWATMWNERANDQIAPALGIDPKPVMHCDHFGGWDEAKIRNYADETINALWYAKTPLIPAYAAGQPFAWVDDDHSAADERWLRAQPDSPEQFLLLRTDAERGLGWDNVADLIAWAKALRSGDLAPMPEAHVAKAPRFTEPEYDFDFTLDRDSDEFHAFLNKMEDEYA